MNALSSSRSCASCIDGSEPIANARIDAALDV
jgi:hypothetical protein